MAQGELLARRVITVMLPGFSNEGNVKVMLKFFFIKKRHNWGKKISMAILTIVPPMTLSPFPNSHKRLLVNQGLKRMVLIRILNSHASLKEFCYQNSLYGVSSTFSLWHIAVKITAAYCNFSYFTCHLTSILDGCMILLQTENTFFTFTVIVRTFPHWPTHNRLSSQLKGF